MQFIRIHDNRPYAFLWGKEYKVTALFSSLDKKANVDAANAYLQSPAGANQGVLLNTKDDTLVVLVDLEDKGYPSHE